MKYRCVASLGLTVFALFLAGCAGPRSYRQTPGTPAVPPSPGPAVNYAAVSYKPQPVLPQGITHTVAPRETLYRLSRRYQVPMEDIIKANKIQDPSRIRKGEKLFIPMKLAPAPPRPVLSVPIPLYPHTGHWRYIVVHHTATREGNREIIDLIHRNRGFGELGYHFIIDNGTARHRNGEIEIGSRWYEQKDGAHAKASNFNQKSIGISLIGNFSEERVSEEQLESLTYLVNTLRHHYRIPKTRVLPHRDVPGAATECPGAFFPWSRFREKLD